MKAPFADALMAQWSELVATHLGLHFPPARWGDLERALHRAAPSLGCAADEESFVELADRGLDTNQVEILARYLTVGETYFWREKPALEALETQILPPLIQARRGSDDKTLKIWSAGCCTGEEPYSVAILLAQLVPDIQNWRIKIFGTDINSQFLQKAETGVYGEWSFRGVPPGLREKYFHKTPQNRHQILSKIAQMVKFFPLNLAEDAFPAILNDLYDVDVILCRNVLIYLTPAHIRKAAANFYRCLCNGGWLILSPAEASPTHFAQFHSHHFPGAILYRKEVHAPIPAFVPPASLAPPIAVTPPVFVAPKVIKKPIQAPKTPVAEPNFWEKARNEADAGKLDAALETIRCALARDKMNPLGHYLHATILQEQGATPEAVAALKRAIYLDPDFVMAHFALGNLWREAKKPKEAQKSLQNALSALQNCDDSEIVPHSDDLPARRLQAIITALLQTETSP